ncbi:hypothetical protein HBA55_02760 [Pseudomaricurvus alkylphenolicus]|uniref:helix-turn-helix transcriptional regulator n=1 Tax=Pseudomaricurvus alkylphenolicus TaxID=1306991 RepID=UPI0014229170|nr:hypothetical protein [Pseudomaricurvus alkylphenolicus]NIB38486.1 hypothetical protein [Pseudomaricurvus alkylphenolicus]
MNQLNDLEASSSKRKELGPIDYDQLADLIFQKLRKTPLDKDVIWNADDCAEYLRVKRRQFIDRISKKPGFPMPLNCGCKWLKSEVIAWVKKR